MSELKIDIEAKIYSECAKEFSEHFKIPLSILELRSKSRAELLVFTRFLVCYYLRGRGLSLNSVGRILNMDHATVNHLMKHYKGGAKGKFSSLKSEYERKIDKITQARRGKALNELSGIEQRLLELNVETARLRKMKSQFSHAS